ncbi:olfactory receptor 5T17-like [Emydura macquarii macquarii]|uniref:olfactory receptor 5T17-like n=1 Tax=Emydura macquarii macquarii TaxID=1129001 RepID=UPI00352A80F1
MATANHSTVTKFILLGLTDHLELQVPLFVVFLVIYIITLVGNLGMIVLIKIDHQLHTPMYFFLSHLSFLDACCSSAVAPKMLAICLSESRTISFAGCAAQLGFVVSFGSIECFLLAVMAYDRYVAICNPLLYTTVMSPRMCAGLVTASYIGGILHSLVHTIFTFASPFCGTNEINHYFCDIPPILSLSCSDTHLNEMLLFILVSTIEVITILAILVSYSYILSTILGINSARGRRKTFSTCASHLTGVTIYHGTILFMYLRPSSSYSLDRDKLASVFYTLVVPMLNPLIYSLRNKEVKDALRRLIGQMFSNKKGFCCVFDFLLNDGPSSKAKYLMKKTDSSLSLQI